MPRRITVALVLLTLLVVGTVIVVTFLEFVSNQN
jgi:hypothetical protein